MTQDEMNTDVETRSAVDLRKSGAARYFEDPTTDVLLAAFQMPDGREIRWDRTQDCPDDVAHHIRSGGLVPCFNAQFEMLAFHYVLGPRYGFPVPKISQYRDTMAQAAAVSIPQSLDGAAQALGLEHQKDKDGMRLIRKFSMPRKARKGEAPGMLYWNEPADHPDDFHKFGVYCIGDTRVEKEMRAKLVQLSDYEQKVWELTALMNLRGVHLDMALVDALQRVAGQAKDRLDKEMAEVTGYAVSACSQVAALTRWLQAQGVDADKLNKNAIEDLLSLDLPEQARRAVELRKEAAKTSTAKLDAMQAVVCRDDRARGLHLYHGAGTGRWSGRLIQTQNMPRGTGTVKDPEDAVDDMLTGDARWIDMIYGQPMSAVSDMLRSCITASPGNRLLAADYSSIEGRVTAWLAGEQWKLDAFIANDEGRGPGMYELAAAGIFNLPVEKIGKKSSERQVGKAAELGLGFGGGVMAFDSMARVYGIDMSPVFPILRGTADPETWERAEKRYDECLERGDTGTDVMSREAWIASEVTKVQWRARHPSTVELWRGLEDAAREAVQNPGAIATYGRISYIVRRGFLWCRLPSGRCLAYGSPRIEDRKTPWGDTKPSVTALGVDSVTKRWTRFALYGGLLTENCLSGSSEVLTDSGWQRMDTVDTSMSVWDGQEFVRHSGLVKQGEKETVCFGGLWLTPDHKVLTHDGWKRASDTKPDDAASSGAELAWAKVRALDRIGIRRIERGEEPVVDRVRLRDDPNYRGDGPAKGIDAKLRLFTVGRTVSPSEDARHVEAPGLRSVAVHARQMSSADSPRLGELRRARYLGLRAMEIIRELLGRHGSKLRVWFDARQRGQQRQLRADELPVGSGQDQFAQQANELGHRDPGRSDATVRSSRDHRPWQDNAVLPGESRMARGSDVRPAGLPQPRVEPVYDLLNCGPRHRFVARGGPGQRPFIVHNCVQAVARDLMAHGMLTAEAAGYPMVMTVHDEGVADVPEGHGTLAEFERLLCSLPDWAAGLPVVASGYESFRYKKD